MDFAVLHATVRETFRCGMGIHVRDVDFDSRLSLAEIDALRAWRRRLQSVDNAPQHLRAPIEGYVWLSSWDK
uniref:hypothetical protein n=1 Tax=Salmonella sp. SAL4358 TaxID=3159879 RepID=UPI00397A926F